MTAGWTKNGKECVVLCSKIRDAWGYVKTTFLNPEPASQGLIRPFTGVSNRAEILKPHAGKQQNEIWETLLK